MLQEDQNWPSTTSEHELLWEQETLDWHMQWYPVAFLDYLDPKVPYPVELLGERLVLWRDAKQHWRCFEDKCPHRLAPLSGMTPSSCIL